MVKAYKLHKIAGIGGGVFLFILALSGFFLDHDYWQFQYTTTFTTNDETLLKKEQRLVTSLFKQGDYVVVASMRGVYESVDGANNFVQTLPLIALKLISYKKNLLCATNDGIYIRKNGKWQRLILGDKVITSLALYGDTLVAVEEKQKLYTIDLIEKKIIHTATVEIARDKLQEDIALARFVRDLHYGRGIFENSVSLLLNDYATLFLVFLTVSGYVIWYLVRTKRHAKYSRKLIKLHSNVFAVFASFFLFILAVTGVFLDHSSALARFMKSITVSHTILPPVYHSLQEDIWSVDYDGTSYRIGNRFGVYKSRDLRHWELESRGFAYSMTRLGDALYIGGMGAPNRICRHNACGILAHTPHMFKEVYVDNDKTSYLSSHENNSLFPKFNDITLYTFMLALHDGSFFAPWWIWVNDFAAAMLLVLIVTGIYRWRKKKRPIKQKG